MAHQRKDDMGHDDIRIGTLATLDNNTAKYLRQVVPHGFESFALTAWKHLPPDLDFGRVARETAEALGGRAIISSLGVYGNVLEDERTRKDLGRAIEACRLFGCGIVTGFAGAVEGKPMSDSMPRFKEVWGELVKKAEAGGVRLALENCDMGGHWHDVRWNIAHSPTAWEMIFDAIPSDALGLEWEPCHQMVSLIDPIPQLRKWVPKVYHVHGKDATVAWDVVRTSGIRGGRPYVWHRTPGFGDTNWADVISILRMNKYQGTIDIEGWHDPVYGGDLEMTGQVHGLNYLKHCRGGAYVPNPEK